MLFGGCQSTQQIPFEPSVQINQKPVQEPPTQKSPKFIYDPQGKEEFILNEGGEYLQRMGYEAFSESTKAFYNYKTLPYAQYKGMKGYFESTVPVRKDDTNHAFYSVVLENGEKYYFISNNRYGGKYGTLSPIISFKQHLQLKSFQPEPFISNASIRLISNSIQGGTRYFKLSNGRSVSDKKLKLIRYISNRFENSPEMAELLLDVSITKDEIENRYFISPVNDFLNPRSEAKVYIGLNEDNEWLRFKVKYYDDDWLFVKSFIIAADDYRWQSSRATFERDNSSGSVWEWLDVLATDKEIEAANALATAKKSTIRFQGSQYHSDKVLQDDQKSSIKKILKLYSLMKKNNS